MRTTSVGGTTEHVPPPALTTTRARSRRHARAQVRQALGRVLIVWIVAYAVLVHGGQEPALALATIEAVVYLPFLQWSSRSARAMPLVYGVWIVAALGVASGFAALSAISFWVDAFGRQDLVLVAVLSFLALGTWGEFVRRAATAPLRIAVIGGGAQVAELLAEIERRSDADRFKIVGIAAETITSDLIEHSFRVVGLDDLEALVADVEPALIIVAVDHGRPVVFSRLLALASTEQFSVLGLPEFYEVAFARLPVHALTPAWFMSTLHFYNRPYNQLAKRSFDVVLSVVGLILAMPLLLAAALIVKSTPGPLLYRQNRLGEYGRIFEILKLRSMSRDAEADGAAVFAAANDPRIIPGGLLIRRLRIDEIPQLWNVLRGDMSIVGPRPERPEFLDLLAKEVPFWTQRNLLRPGVTGWAQIRAGYTSDSAGAETKLSYDLWYLRHRSLMLDSIICLRTIRTMLTASGSR